MKNTMVSKPILIIALIFLLQQFAALVYASTNCRDCLENVGVSEPAVEETVHAFLNTGTGIEFIHYIQQMGGALDFAGSRSINRAELSVVLIPAGRVDGKQLNLLYYDKKNFGAFLFLIEFTATGLNIFQPELTIHLLSGKKISVKNMTAVVQDSEIKFQEYDDITDSVSFFEFLAQHDSQPGSLMMVSPELAALVCVFICLMPPLGIIFWPLMMILPVEITALLMVAVCFILFPIIIIPL